MFGLVDQALRAELLARGDEALAIQVNSGDPRGERALDHPVHPADGEAALGGLLDLGARPLDLRLDRDDARIVDVHNRDAQRHADLRRRDTHAARDHHRREHPRDERLELRTRQPRLLRGRVQHRIADLTDLHGMLRDEVGV